MPLDLEAPLIDGARSGGAELERLIATVWPEAYRIAFSMLRDRGLAEDAAQEACAAIARSLPSLKKTDGFSAWSYKIIVNHTIVAARRRRRTVSLDELPAAAGNADRSDALDLHDALMKLPVEQRGAIVLHYYVGLNSREIAAATGLPGIHRPLSPDARTPNASQSAVRSCPSRTHNLPTRYAQCSLMPESKTPWRRSLRASTFRPCSGTPLRRGSRSRNRSNGARRACCEWLSPRRPVWPSCSWRFRPSSLGLVRIVVSSYQDVIKVIGWTPPAGDPKSSVRGTAQADAAAAQAYLDFALVPPSGLPADVVATKIWTIPTQIYTKATHVWETGPAFALFTYRRAGGRSFSILADRFDPRTGTPSKYMFLSQDLPGGRTALTRYEKFIWRNGDQVTSIVAGDGISAERDRGDTAVDERRSD